MPHASPRRPVIGINCDHFDDPMSPLTGVRAPYWEAVLAAGGIPLLVPFLTQADQVTAVLDRLDGMVLTGGDDLGAARLGEIPQPGFPQITPARDRSDFLLLDALLARRLPTLAICLGFQELNVSLGGRLHLDLASTPDVPFLDHRCPPGKRFALHPVRVAPGSLLAAIWGSEAAEVPSAHHQGIQTPGAGLRPIAWAPDGLIEAVQLEDHPFFLGVQWHPERIPDDPRQRALFESLTQCAWDQ